VLQRIANEKKMENGRHPKPTTSSHSRPQKEAFKPNTKRDQNKDKRKKKEKRTKEISTVQITSPTGTLDGILTADRNQR
jgi:hypothetical protein